MTAVIYARYSSDNQREESIEGQIRECTAYAEKNGITIVKHYIDRAISAKTDNRPEFQQMIKDSDKKLFDIVLVWKLDRLSRSLKDVLALMEKINQAGAGFQSLTEAIDTTTPAGRMMMQIVATFAEFERAMLRERTRKGLEQARSQGRIGGRRPKLKPHQQDEIIRSVQSGQKTAADAARLFNIHPSTVSRLLRKAER